MRPVDIYKEDDSESLREKLIVAIDDIYSKFSFLDEGVYDFVSMAPIMQQPVSSIESDEVPEGNIDHDTLDNVHQDVNTTASPTFAGLTQVGTSANYLEVESDGTIKFNGTATVFDDIFLPIAITKLGATAPTWAAFQGNISQFTFAINDYVQGSFELKHGYKEGSDLNVHVHIVTNGAEAAKEARYSFEYWIADMGEASVTTTTITSADKALTNADGHHEYIDIGDITGTGFKIGAVVCFLFKRVALVGGDDPSADPFVVSVGCHYEKDTVGSRTETAK